MTVGKTTTTLITCAAVALLAVGAIVYHSKSAATNSANAPTAAARSSSPAASGSFREIYALAPGEAMKFVKPPFDSSRADYMRKTIHFFGQGELPPEYTSDKTALVLEWWDDRAGDELQFRALGNYEPTLKFIAAAILDADSTDVTGPPALLERVIEGDWVYRKLSSPTQRAANISRTLRDKLGIAAKIERKRANIEAIVISGGGLAASTQPVQIYSDKLTDGHADYKAEERTFKDLVGTVQLATRKRVINESSVGDNAKIRFSLHTSGMMNPMPPARGAAKLDLILANLSRQTGLRFTRATRSVETWVVTPGDNR